MTESPNKTSGAARALNPTVMYSGTRTRRLGAAVGTDRVASSSFSRVCERTDVYLLGGLL
jgi:hypothetical protein